MIQITSAATGEVIFVVRGRLTLPDGSKRTWAEVTRDWSDVDLAAAGLIKTDVAPTPPVVPPPVTDRQRLGAPASGSFNSAVVLALAEITGKTREETLDWLAAKLD